MGSIAIPYNLSKTINSPRSVRSFKTDSLKPEALARLTEFSKNVRMSFACDTEIRFLRCVYCFVLCEFILSFVEIIKVV